MTPELIALLLAAPLARLDKFNMDPPKAGGTEVASA